MCWTLTNKEIHSPLNPLFMLKHVVVSDDILGGGSAEFREVEFVVQA